MSDIAAWPFIDGVDAPKKENKKKGGDANTNWKKREMEKGGGKKKRKNSPDSAVRPQNMHVRYWDLDM
jgi:hypothetical protein